jgi:hypothetical protein
VGLKDDGTVVAVGRHNEQQLNVDDWTYIKQIAAGWSHTVGLMSNGTVVCTGQNYCGECDVSGWGNIIHVAAGGEHMVGLCRNATVVATDITNPADDVGQCNVGNWDLTR